MIKLLSWSPPSLSIVVILTSVFVLRQPFSTGVLGYRREDFSSDFVFGSGTSAYQVEGAAAEDGRTPSVYDTQAHNDGAGGYNGDVACDQYHKYKDDVQLMVQTGLEAYRFSISWSRLISNGRGPINSKGVEYYNNLINELLNYGIQPHVTLLHLDLPQALADSYDFQGWQDHQFVEDFTKYADICFQEFGDRVLYWTTINEANYDVIVHYYNKSPYIVAHNYLLGHASVVKLYRERYQVIQQGYVGLNIGACWYIPEGNNEEDLVATERVNNYMIGWFMHPLVFGDYPDIMQQNLGKQLPSFTEEETQSMKGSFDFIGVNSYSGKAIQNDPGKVGFAAKCLANKKAEGKFIQGVLEYFKHAYGNPPIFIHENGLRTRQNPSLNDSARVDFLSGCIGSLLDAARNGSNVKGYFQWSFLDLYETPFHGYMYSFGFYYVDLDDPDLKRYPKTSAYWYSNFLKRNVVSSFNNPIGWKSANRELSNRETRVSQLKNLNVMTSSMQNEDINEMFLCLIGNAFPSTPPSSYLI